MAHQLLIILAFAGRICAGLVFVTASVQKAQAWTILPGVIANYRLLPRGLVAPAAWLLPPVEMVLGIGLLSGLAQGWSVPAAILLLLVFAAAMAINLQRGRAHVDCGCGRSQLKQTLRPALVVRNGVLALLLSLSPAAVGGLAMAAALTGVAAGLGFFLLYLVVNMLCALPGTSRPLAA